MLYTEDFTMRHYVGFSQISLRKNVRVHTQSGSTLNIESIDQFAHLNIGEGPILWSNTVVLVS